MYISILKKRRIHFHIQHDAFALVIHRKHFLVTTWHQRVTSFPFKCSPYPLSQSQM
ncbi:hypothetical protein BJV77DRAFT_972990 [Russula vinacea]|nr:hypothetical protein BJV77DRAFT_972990 [Russula vinacea]